MTARDAPRRQTGHAARRLRAAAVASVLVYLAALVLAPSGARLWRELGLQVLSLGLVAAYIWVMVARGVRAGEPWYRQWRTGTAAWITFFALGNLVANAHTGPVIPDWANVWSMVLYVCSYPGAVLGIVRLQRGRWRSWDAAAVMDSMISASAIAALFTAFILPRALAATAGSDIPLALVLAFPVCDLTVLGVTMAATNLGGGGRRRPSAWLMLGIALFGAADWQFAIGAAEGTWRTGTWRDGVWVIASAVLGLLACERGARADTSEQGERAWTLAGVAIPMGAAMAALVVLTIGTRSRLPITGIVTAVVAVTTALLRLAVAYAQVRALAETSRMARTDELTGLLNRRALLETLSEIGAGSGHRPYAVLLTDLDGFKEVNDTLGHAAGDELLRLVTGRLRAAVPEDGVLARLGGDEFAVVLPDVDGAPAVAQALVAALATPLVVAGREIRTAVSVGLATDDGRAAVAPDELLRRADIAMYVAKRAGGARAHVFAPVDDHAEESLGADGAQAIPRQGTDARRAIRRS